jgi:hypothetical protein
VHILWSSNLYNLIENKPNVMFNETKRLGLNIVFEKSLIRKLTSVLLA